MGNPKTIAKLTKEIADINENIESLKDVCKDLKGNDNEMCSLQLRKKAASGQHGIKDNVTRKQAREGLQERIDQLKRDVAKKSKELLEEATA